MSARYVGPCDSRATLTADTTAHYVSAMSVWSRVDTSQHVVPTVVGWCCPSWLVYPRDPTFSAANVAWRTSIDIVWKRESIFTVVLLATILYVDCRRCRATWTAREMTAVGEKDGRHDPTVTVVLISRSTCTASLSRVYLGRHLKGSCDVICTSIGAGVWRCIVLDV